MDMKQIYVAQKRLYQYLEMTPLIYSPILNQLFKKDIWLKLETQLPTGSFKPRAAFNSILTHFPKAKKQGVIASSSGNFAQGVAYAAHELQVNALIVMTKSTSPYKIQRTKQLGAKVVLCDDTHEDRIHTTLTLQQKTGRVLLQPYDSEETIMGDATIGLELFQQLDKKLNRHTAVLVPVSGGGLVAGIAYALKHLQPHCKIIGVQPKNNGALAKAFHTGKCVRVKAQKSIADALGAPILGEIPFQFIKEYVDDVVLIGEKDIQKAAYFLIEQHKLVVEPGGAISVAALFANKISEKNIICILSGGNTPITVNF